MADTKRLTIKDLIPSTDYAVQIRAVNDAGETSEWSRKFTFTTTDDNVAPKVPTNFTFLPGDAKFVASWSEVTKNVDESNARIIRYGLRLENGNDYHILQIEPSGDGTVTYSLTQQRVEALFGKGVDTLTAKVRAVNIGDIQGAYTAPITASLAGPAAPTNAVVEETVDGLNISWTPPADLTNVDGYHVYISTTAGFTPAISNRIYEGQATTCTYNTSTYALHYIAIRSYSRFGKESPDLAATGTPVSPYGPDTTAPSVPGSLAVSVDRSGAVARAAVSWTFSATGTNTDIQSFAIRYRKVGDTNWFMEFASKDARNLYVDLPQPYANYEFQIASIDFVANYSAWSATTTLSAGIAGAPPQTTGVTATPGLGSIQLSWTASTHADVTYGGYYDVQIATNSAFTTGLLSYKTGNTSISITGLSLGTVYYYRVRAVDVDGNAGTWSTTGNVTTGDVIIPEPTDGNPPASSPAATVTPGFGYLFVNWSPVSNADPVTYEVHISTTSTFTPTLGGTTLVAQTPGTVVTLTKDAAGAALNYGTTYYVRIIAKDADTTSGNAPAAGTVGSGAPKKVGSGDVISVIADQIATGSLGAAVITIATGGVIQSTNYVANTTGFKLSDTVVDIQSGTVNFGTLRAGTVTTTGLSIGAGGLLTVDSTGAIQSNNYAAGSTGWKLSSTGLDAPGFTINVSNVIGDTISGRNLTVTSGGAVSSSNWNGSSAGWQLSSSGLTMYNGTIYGPSVQTNQLYSISTDPTTGQYLFSINAGGYAQFSGARILGNTILGSASSSVHYIQSYSYSPGSTGWKISATGASEFNGPNITNSSITASSFSTYGYQGDTTNYSTVSQTGLVNNNGSQSASIAAIAYNGGPGNLLPGVTANYGGSFGRIVWNGSDWLIMGGLDALDVSNGGTINNGLTINSGGITVSGTASFNNTMNVSGVLSVSQINSVSTINGGPTINGNPQWTAASTGGSANVNWNNGHMQPISSSRRYKTDIEKFEVDIEKVYSLVPRKYTRIGQGFEIGFIAEEALDIGLDEWVTYNENGEVESFDYYKYVVALQAAVRHQNDETTALREEVQELKELIKSLVAKA